MAILVAHPSHVQLIVSNTVEIQNRPMTRDGVCVNMVLHLAKVGESYDSICKNGGCLTFVEGTLLMKSSQGPWYGQY